MTHRKCSTAVGVFQDRRQAQQAVKELRQAGFREDEIGVISRDGEGMADDTRAEDRGSRAGTGAVTGAVAGAGTGALWALGIAAGVLPAIGPVVAGGLLASVLASAAGTAVAGGIVGALIGLGVPEDEARYYEEEFQGGRTLVTVKSESRYDEARGILQRCGAYDQSTAPSASAHAAGTDWGSETEHRTLDVPVEQEEVVMERHPASERAPRRERPENQELRVPVEEEAKVEHEGDVRMRNAGTDANRNKGR